MNMRNITLLALLATVMIFSCKKKDNTGNDNKLVYSLSGIAGYHVTQYRDTTIYVPISVLYTSGSKESISFKVSGIPVDCSIAPAEFSGVPPFAVTCTLHIWPTVAGDIQLYVTGTSARGDTSQSKITLTSVAGSADCSDMYLGTFSCTDSMFYASDTMIHSIGRSHPVINHVSGLAKLYFNSDVPTRLNVNCSNDSVTTDATTSTHVTTEPGRGYRDMNNIYYSQIVHVDSVSEPFISRVHLVRQ